jgi:hypothetical protein
MERGWWDFAVDPLRYRMTVDPGIVERLGRLLPPPDVVMFLEAPAEILAKRKSELTPAELDRQMKTWRQVKLPKRTVRAYLDASATVEDLVLQARGHMGQVLGEDHGRDGPVRGSRHMRQRQR